MTSDAGIELPAKLAPERLADLCREVAAEKRVQPQALEKDHYLTRLIWGLAQVLGEKALLKGGTLLSKVDLGFRRMSEDVDLVLPGEADAPKRTNALRMNSLRNALAGIADVVGVRLPFRHGVRTDRDAHAHWELFYDSEFGEQRILVETTVRPVIEPPRRVQLLQVLHTPGFEVAYCWALDESEARAEKVRAAFTRRVIRDYFDLQALAEAGRDLTSPEFLRLVDRKLVEIGAARLRDQPASFGMSEAEKTRLMRQAREELSSVVRIDEPRFDLPQMLKRFDALWGK